VSKRSAFVVGALVALAVAAGALAAAFTVTINLKGGLGNRTYKACGLTHHYTLFHPGRAIAIEGAVRPAPASFRVKLKVKQCLHGSFKTIWVGPAHERPDGSYRGAYVPHRRGSFFARAYVHAGSNTIESDKRYFQVR
jgi:hypothetical protein